MKKFSFILIIGIFAIFVGCKKKAVGIKTTENNTTSNYHVGGYYDKNGITGIICKVSSDGNHGTVVSLDEAKLPWSLEYVTTGASDYMNGPFNTNTIISNFDLEKYPAFKWCNDKNTAGISGWYMPSISEVGDILRVREILDEGLLNNGGVVMHIPWSSTEKDNQTAYCNHLFSYTEKWIEEFVRAVHSF